MADFLLAALRALAVPVDGPCPSLSTEQPPAATSLQTTPRGSIIPPASGSTANKASTSTVQDFTPRESVSNELPPSHCMVPPASMSQPKEDAAKMTNATSSTAAIPATSASNDSLELIAVDDVNVPTQQDAESSRSQSPDFSTGDYHFVPLEDTTDSEDWLLIPEEPKSVRDTDSTADISATFLDSFNNNVDDHIVPCEEVHSDSTSDQESESLKSFESHEFNYSNLDDIQRIDDSSLCFVPAVSSQRSSSSSDSDDVDLPEASEAESIDDPNSDCSGISFRELFNDPVPDELDWEDDHFHDCGDEFGSEMNESFNSEHDSEPLFPLEGSSSCDDECLMMLFYEEENDRGNREGKMLDVVEVLQPRDFSSAPSGYPVKDLPILEGNFFHLVDTPPYEQATKNNNSNSHNKAMFLFEIPEKFKEESVVQDMGADVITSFSSAQEFGKCDIVFGDFDSLLPPTPRDTQDSPDSSSPSAPPSPRATPSPSPDKSMSLSSLPSSDALFSSSSDCSCTTCPSPTLSSEFFPCSDNLLPAENDADQLDSLEEKCFKLYDENDVDASFDCFPMRLQARKVDYRGCGTRKTRRRRKRW